MFDTDFRTILGPGYDLQHFAVSVPEHQPRKGLLYDKQMPSANSDCSINGAFPAV
jgi:hypothetical protein